MKTKIETLRNNIHVLNNALATFDFSILDPRDALGIKTQFEDIRMLLDSYMDFELGINPDKKD